MSQLLRPVIAMFACMSAWLLTAVLVALGAPGWAVLLGYAVMAVSIVVTTFTVHLSTREHNGGEGGPGRSGDQGGGGPRRLRPDAPPRGGGGGDPTWWPEFERGLASYVAEREEAPGRRSSARSPV